MYIRRAMEARVKELAGFFPVVLVCGPRQVGKTTLLKQLSESTGKKLDYITLDYPQVRQLAINDPELFLQRYQPPIIIDEIQYAPQLLPYIKIRVDQENTPGQYLLTGSQMFHMMKNVSETLAGRVGILTLYSLSQAELAGSPSKPFLPMNDLAGREPIALPEVFNRIYRGSMPMMAVNPDLSAEDFYGSYLQTYLERDIRDLVLIKDEGKFLRFLSCVAARTGQELVLADLARSADIDGKTADSWLSILVSSGLVFLLKPYFTNTVKRLVKRPKLYFTDTGLACFLSLWNNPRALEVSAMAGAMLETYVVSEVLKSYANAGKDARNHLCYYRDGNGEEIDLVILDNGTAYPVEIKMSADPGKNAMRHFHVLEKLGLQMGEGAVICLTPMPLPLTAQVRLVPVGCI